MSAEAFAAWTDSSWFFLSRSIKRDIRVKKEKRKRLHGDDDDDDGGGGDDDDDDDDHLKSVQTVTLLSQSMEQDLGHLSRGCIIGRVHIPHP